MADGAVAFLLENLSTILGEEKRLLGGLAGEVEYIRDELGQMNEFLRVAQANEETDQDLKEWLSQLREISYDLEYVVDKYMLRLGRYHGICRGIKKVHACVKNLKAKHHIASEIRAIKYRLKNVTKSQQTYREMFTAMGQGSGSTIPKKEIYDGRGDALFLEDAEVVGIEKPKNQLLEWIFSKDDGIEVISVVGMGGLGKTTLVKKVYDDASVQRYFNHHVWLVVSEYKDIKHMLQNLIKKLLVEIKEQVPQELENMTVDEMKIFIYGGLQKYKYIIVLDDVWDISRWEAIRLALPRRNTHGSLIITTRDRNIGNAACSETSHVYNLEPLPVEESRKLFYKKAFPSISSPPDYLRDFSENILKRCDGLPLAIVVIGGVLATKNNKAEEWEKFNRSMIHESDGGGRRLLKILSLSYNDLPYHLKYCFSYLSIFQGEPLAKETIIRLLVAERFTVLEPDKTMEEIAIGYLNELLCRSLIQVAERGYYGEEIIAFSIHDLVKDYITSKSREHNIVTICNEGGVEWPNKTRRLVIQNSINFSLETSNFKYLRSLVIFHYENMGSIPIKELLSRSRLLKVLHLDGASPQTILEEVSKLYHLKYLCLRGTMVQRLPRTIQYLENLETLNLVNSDVNELPIEILKLHKLKNLYVYKVVFIFPEVRGATAPYGIGNCLLSLQILCYIDADEVDGSRMVREIGKLTQLRVLGITKLRSEDGKDLCSSIAKLTNLQRLDIFSVEEGEKLDLDYSLSSSSIRCLPFLRVLVLHGCIEKIPQWIPSLNGLTTLFLKWSRLKEDPLNSLQYLPNLAFLQIHDAYVEGMNFKANGFQKLRDLRLWELKCLKWVRVEKGSMPFLRRWILGSCKLLTEMPQGIEHLTNLQRVQFQEMGDEFVERIKKEKRSEGDKWRLAHVPHVRFYSLKEGEWELVQN